MARIRTIKPEFWTDEKIGSLPPLARLFFIGLWSFSDDYGVVKGSAPLLKAQVFPFDDDIRLEQVQKCIDALVEARMLIHFRLSNEVYHYIRTFAVHQKVDKPSKWRACSAEDLSRALAVKGLSLQDDSVNVHGALAGNSRGLPEPSTQERERERERYLERERECGQSDPPIPPSADSKINDATDRDALAQSLGRPQVSDSEILIWQNLLKLGCDLKDVESARKAKGKNSLHYLKNIVCEERDKRLTGGKKPGFDVFEALKEKRENGNA